ncbi:unnamed protein product [Chilo suppressalis]|uniref:RAB6-interacting golgin n=1 Tax=Chilo suppressalis TaxID=168631 RepID=A0ABN8AXF3_CHISP|nr:hypothetical protein evm_004729 [Chilo suppressalis]CAH0398616.1 unnamed protein product [Chilo suppressalis]
MSFTGFSEEDLQRIKSNHITGSATNDFPINTSTIKKLDRLGAKSKRTVNSYKVPTMQQETSDEALDDIDFKKCKLSLRSTSINSQEQEIAQPETEDSMQSEDLLDLNENIAELNMEHAIEETNIHNSHSNNDLRKYSTTSTPDIVRGVTDYTEDELAAHRAKLEELQLKQKIMEEQNKKRKEMLAKALADRTKQTEEEVMRLEKIKKELQVLDGQFSLDVAVLRKKIDQACLSFAEAEKHYLKVEKEFLQAKITLQKEKEKKELLTEHLCALITHNETRKAQKLETLMLELASDKKLNVDDTSKPIEDEEPIIIDGVDQKTGKIVEIPISS